jgi:hypothetical protein
MRRSRLFAGGALFSSFAWVLAGGCSSSSSSPPSNSNGMNTGGTIGGTQGDAMVLAPDGPGVDGGPNDNLNPLCGVGQGAGTCLPDNDSACRGYMPPKQPGAGGVGAGGESNALGGEAGISAGGAAHGGAPDGAGGAGNSGVGGEGGSGNQQPPGLAQYSCQVTRQDSKPLRQCMTAGTGKANAPCFSAADCAPSFACVTEGDVGRCLPYCCDKSSTCRSGTYCADRPLRKAPSDTSNAEPLHVPVCVPADDCSLEDQFPCPASTECRCKGDTACMVVRDDGTTTCLKPGAGQQGDACPCAWNHVCSSVTNKCVKICRTDPSKTDCGTQKCQASSELPKNYGVCVGPLK